MLKNYQQKKSPTILTLTQTYSVYLSRYRMSTLPKLYINYKLVLYVERKQRKGIIALEVTEYYF